MNISLPTQHQIAVAGTHAVAIAAGAVSALAFAGVLTTGDNGTAAEATGYINRIFADLKDLYGAVAGLVGIGTLVYASIKSNPIVSFFRSALAIQSDPKMMAQAKTASLNDKAPVVAITDSLPEVVGVATSDTRDGKALATAVPSNSVQVSIKG